jgi:hypothetical protein
VTSAPATAVAATPARAPTPVRSPRRREAPRGSVAPTPGGPRTRAREPASATGSTPIPAIDGDRLVTAYKALGARIDALVRHDPDAAAQLRQRYFRIPIADALRRPAMRAEVAAAIAAVERDIAASE